jgi:hypothetical protein
MLKAVVKKEHVDGLLLLDATAFGKAIFADAKRNPALETMLHQLDFVARAARTAISPAQNCDALAFREKFLCEPQNHGRLASTAHGQITDANDLGAEAPLLEPAFVVKPGAHPNVAAIQDRKRPEQDSHR